MWNFSRFWFEVIQRPQIKKSLTRNGIAAILTIAAVFFMIWFCDALAFVLLFAFYSRRLRWNWQLNFFNDKELQSTVAIILAKSYFSNYMICLSFSRRCKCTTAYAEYIVLRIRGTRIGTALSKQKCQIAKHKESDKIGQNGKNKWKNRA